MDGPTLPHSSTVSSLWLSLSSPACDHPKGAGRVPVRVARKPAELCPEGLLSVGKASVGVPLQSCTSSSIGASSGNVLGEEHCAGQKTASLTEYLRGLSKCLKDDTECHQTACCSSAFCWERLSPAMSRWAPPASVIPSSCLLLY